MTRSFHTTRWTLVHNAHGDTAEARDALAQLCEFYYGPVLAFLRREGRDEDKAKELAHGFFNKILAGDFLEDAGRDRGRFRSYLLGALKHFLMNCRRDEARAKRGGEIEHLPLEDDDWQAPPASDAFFDREWALSIVEHALHTVEQEEIAAGKAAQFAALKPWLDAGGTAGSQEDCARELGISTGALKVAIHRLRKRFRELVRQEVAATLHDPIDLDEEMRHLVEALAAR
ncbi:sigma-70 family RNA polymerase sigma factor [Haloferula sp. BvORR071]|uniref:RNA polymerase sigma factor n=1 Tax=Haloferula sp. BvORR071 TaxID=1396141 RepID=UPI000555D467|nr:sigma-70 family RNA polymerase sigma factor [Haloferula sp. BvORR071]